MKIAAVIAEYHPFHNGHAHLCARLRELGWTHIATVMSGNFVQRGGFAVLDKSTRTHAALLGGVDLVLEIPLPYAMATAERFAYGAVASLSSLGCINTLAFGSEIGETAPILSCAKALLSSQLRAAMRPFLSQGRTFAAARQQGMASLLGEEAARLLSTPNNTLGVEYCKQLLLQHSSMEPFTIPRAGTAHDSAVPSGNFASASYLRQFLARGEVQALEGWVPPQALSLYQSALEAGRFPLDKDGMELILLGKLRGMTVEALAQLPDVSEGLEHRIYDAVREGCRLEEVLSRIKTKRYALSRLRRILWAALVGLTAQDNSAPPPYLRILGMNSRGREILAAAKGQCTLPLSASLSKLREASPQAARFASLEAGADDLYALCQPKRRPCGRDYTDRAVIL